MWKWKGFKNKIVTYFTLKMLLINIIFMTNISEAHADAILTGIDL